MTNQQADPVNIMPLSDAGGASTTNTPAPLRPRAVPLNPHQVNRRVQVLAATLGLEGVSSHSGRLAASPTRRPARP